MLAAAGCGGAGGSYDAADPGTLASEEVLVLGRVRVFYDGDDVSGMSKLVTAEDGPRYRLPSNGLLSWRLRRSSFGDTNLIAVVVEGDRGGTLELGEHKQLLVPEAVRESVFYVGDIVVAVGTPPDVEDIALSARSRSVAVGRADHVDEVLSRLVRDNRALRGEQYYNVLRGAMAQAPSP
jgi:hypothetical protein